MNAFDFDVSALQEELTRVTVDKKPGAIKKFGNFLDKVVKMPEKSGYVTIRLLPSLPNHNVPYAACRIHNLAPMEEREQKKTKNEYCGKTLQGRKWVGECFYCDYYNHLYRKHDKAIDQKNEDLAKQLKAKASGIKPQEKYYYNAIVMDSYPSTGQSMDDGPLVYSCGITIHARILEAVLGNVEMKKKPKGNVFHPINGRNLKVVKELKPGGQFPDYNGSEWEDVSPLSEDSSLVQKWLSSMNDVFALRKVSSVEEMQRIIRVFEGQEQDSRKTFDDSFLSRTSETTNVSTPTPSVKTSSVSHSALNIDIDDDPLVDDEFSNNVRMALEAAE